MKFFSDLDWTVKALLYSCVALVLGIGWYMGLHPTDIPPAPVAHTSHITTDIQGEFRAKVYPINEFEHVVIFDVPDRFSPIRCWTFVNEKTNAVAMHCDDEGYSPLPLAGAELAR